MASGNKTAQGAEHSGLGFSQGLQGQSGNLYGTVAPELTAMATHPMGFNPSDLAQMKTEAMQTAGGSNAGAVGQGALLASRTRNAGTADAAISQAARNAGETLSDTGLKINSENARLKEAQRNEGLRGLEGLYGTDIAGANNALGEVARNAEADAAAENAALGPQLLKQVIGNVSYAGKGGFGFGG